MDLSAVCALSVADDVTYVGIRGGIRTPALKILRQAIGSAPLSPARNVRQRTDYLPSAEGELVTSKLVPWSPFRDQSALTNKRAVCVSRAAEGRGADLSDTSSTLSPFLAKLEGHAQLSSEDRDAILSLPHKVQSFEKGAYLFREGERASSCCVILSGFVVRHKITGGGGRQILAVHMAGDGVDLQNALMALADHNIQAVGQVQAAFIPSGAVSELIASHPGAARAMWIETLLDASIQREWIVNVGRRDARARIAHLLCELGLRQESAGLGSRNAYELPLTQEQLADATGLTAVHVNRVLQGLRSEGVITGGHKGASLTCTWDRMMKIGDFRSNYLEAAGEA